MPMARRRRLRSWAWLASSAPSSPDRAGRRPLNRDHLENTSAPQGIGGTRLRHPKFIWIVAQLTHRRGVDPRSCPSGRGQLSLKDLPPPSRFLQTPHRSVPPATSPTTTTR